MGAGPDELRWGRGVRLYRGIAVQPDKVQTIIASIRATGLQAGQGGQWSMTWNDLKPKLQELRNLDTVTIEHTKPGAQLPRVCACGDGGGAPYYAIRHNRSGNNDTPIL